MRTTPRTTSTNLCPRIVVVHGRPHPPLPRKSNRHALARCGGKILAQVACRQVASSALRNLIQPYRLQIPVDQCTTGVPCRHAPLLRCCCRRREQENQLDASCACAVVTAIPQPRECCPGASSNTNTPRLASVRDPVPHGGMPVTIVHGRARSPRQESVSTVAPCRDEPLL